MAHLAITIYLYPAVAADLAPSTPYELEPGVLGTAVVAAFRAIPYTIGACILGAIAYAARGVIGATVGMIFLAALVLSVFAGVMSLPRGCSSSADFQEPRAR